MRKKFLLRLSPELWEEIRRWADEDLRSVNGQIEYLLREALRRRSRPNPTSTPQEDGEEEDD